ncbi:hypothetical protein ACO0QE_002530 [Hanseniaspora vineae]
MTTTHRPNHIDDVRILNTNYNKYYTSIYEKLKHNTSKNKESAYRDDITAGTINISTGPIRNEGKHEANVLHSTKEESKMTSMYQYTYRSLTSPMTYTINTPVEHTKSSKMKELSSVVQETRTLKTRAKEYLKSKLDLSRSSTLLHSNISIHSLTSNGNNTNNNNPLFSRSTAPYKTIDALPQELLTRVYGFLEDDRRALLRGLYVNKHFNKSCKTVLYREITLYSTYRLAQLVTTLQENPQLRGYVEYIDLSQLKSGMELYHEYMIFMRMANKRGIKSATRHAINSNGHIGLNLANTEYLEQLEEEMSTQEETFASWRDWRFRNDLLYSATRLKRQRTMSCSSLSLNNTEKRPRITRNSSTPGTTSSISLATPSQHTQTKNKNWKKYHNNNVLLKSLLIFKVSSFSKNSSGNSSKKLQIFKKNQSRSNSRRTGGDLQTVAPMKQGFPNNATSLTVSKDNDPIPRIQHPLSNKFLSKYCMNKDVPIGQLLHLIDYCSSNLKTLKLNSLSLSEDFVISDATFTKNSQEQASTENTNSSGFIQQKKVAFALDRNYALNRGLVPFNGNFKREDMKIRKKNRKEGDPDQQEESEMDKFNLNGQKEVVYFSDTSYHTLNIEGNPKIKKVTTNDIFEKLTFLKNLRNLEVENCIFINENVVTNLLLKQLPQTSLHQIPAEKSLPRYALQGSGMVQLKWALNGNSVEILIMILLTQLVHRTSDATLEALFGINIHKPLFGIFDKREDCPTRNNTSRQDELHQSNGESLMASSDLIYLDFDTQHRVAFRIFVYETFENIEEYYSYNVLPASDDHVEHGSPVIDLHCYLNKLHNSAIYLPTLRPHNTNINNHIINYFKKLYVQRVKYLRVLRLRDNIGYNMIQYPANYSSVQRQ